MSDAVIERAPVLAEILRCLVEAYQPERVYLFGSKAQGEEGPDSDIPTPRAAIWDKSPHGGLSLRRRMVSPRSVSSSGGGAFEEGA